MNADPTECVRCQVYRTEVLLLRAEIAGLRESVLALTRRPADGASALEIVGMHEAERLAIVRPSPSDPDCYRVSLTYRDHLIARCVIAISDPAAFLSFFEDLGRHRSGWEGEKKVASLEGQFSITCIYEGKNYRPEVSMYVNCALDYPSFDPYWTVQLRLEVDPGELEGIAARAQTVFANASTS